MAEVGDARGLERVVGVDLGLEAEVPDPGVVDVVPGGDDVADLGAYAGTAETTQAPSTAAVVPSSNTSVAETGPSAASSNQPLLFTS